MPPGVIRADLPQIPHDTVEERRKLPLVIDVAEPSNRESVGSSARLERVLKLLDKRICGRKPVERNLPPSPAPFVVTWLGEEPVELALDLAQTERFAASDESQLERPSVPVEVAFLFNPSGGRTPLAFGR